MTAITNQTETLERLIGVIDAKLASVPEHDWRDNASWNAHKAGLEKVFHDLAAEEGARISLDRDASIRLAGIRSTSTCGISGALSNWKRAAAQRIALAKGGAA